MNGSRIARSQLSILCERLIVAGFPLFSFLLAIAFYLKTYDSCQIKITMVHIGVTFFFSIWLIKLFEDNGFLTFWREHKKIILPVLIFLVSGIVSYTLSPFEKTSFEELIRRILYIAAFLIVVSEFGDKKRVESLFRWIILGAFISSMYGIVQWLNLDPFLWKRAFGDRVFSTFGNPNFFSAYLVWICPILLSYFLLTRKYFYGILFVICAFNVMQSQSKASWIGLTAAVIMFAFLAVNFLSHAKKSKIKKVLVLFVIATIIIASFGVFYFITKRINSVRFRVFTWQATWEMICKPKFVSPLRSKIIGNGIGTFKIVYPAYRMPQIFHIEGKHNTETDHPENEFLEVWYDEGIIGIVIFLWLLVTMYWMGIYKINYLSKSLQAMFRKNMTSIQGQQLILQHHLVGVIAGLTGLLVHNLMCVNLRFVSSGFFLWVILGLIIAIIKSLEKLHKETPVIEKKAFNYSAPLVKNFMILAVIGIFIYLTVYFSHFFIADLHHNRGIAYSKAKIWDKAIAEYQKVIKYNPGYIMAYYFLGNVFNDRWNTEPSYNPKWDGREPNARVDADRALEYYDKVRELAPNYVQVHYQTGVVYARLGKWEKAIEYFKKYQELDPVFPQNYSHLGWAYTKIGKWEQAEKVFKDGIAQNPNFFEAYLNLGNAYYMRKKLNEAEYMYKKAIEVSPKQAVNAYRNLIVTYTEQNRQQEAIKVCEALLAVYPNNEYAKKVIQKLRG